MTVKTSHFELIGDILVSTDAQFRRQSVDESLCLKRLTVFIYLNEATHKLNEMLMCMTFL